jgi:hypothetical protein
MAANGHQHEACAPAPRWLPPLFVVLALALVPWIVFLAITLPERNLSQHWDLAWAGFDVGLAVALLATGIAAWRASPWMPAAAMVSATLLVCDAWFDVVTSSTSRERLMAVVLAALCELPLAALCLWTAHHPAQVAGRTEALRETRTWLRRRLPAEPPPDQNATPTTHTAGSTTSAGALQAHASSTPVRHREQPASTR